MPSESYHPAPPIKDDGDDVYARVLREILGFMMLPVYLDEAGESSGLGGSDGLLRGANVGRGAAAHFDGHKRLINDANDIEFSGAIADVLGQGPKTFGFKAPTGKALSVESTPGSGGWACLSILVLHG